MLYVTAFARRAAMLLALWFVLAEGSTYQAWFGVATVLLATAVSLTLAPPRTRWLHLSGLIRLVPFFVWQMISGGVNVGLRALRPRLDLKPVFFTYTMRLERGPAQLCFICIVSLLPGTVSCRLDGDTLTIHLLDQSMAVDPVLRRLEAHVAAAFP